MRTKCLFYQIFITAIIAALLATGLPFTDTSAIAGDEQVTHLPPIDKLLKGHPKLESALDQLLTHSSQAKGPTEISTFAKQRNIDLAGNQVKVIVEALPGEIGTVKQTVTALGGKVEASYKNLVRIVVPVSALNYLANNPAVRYVRQPRKPEQQVISEGVSVINADLWQYYGFSGSGVKVGILDTSFSGYSSLLGTELPASVTVQWFGSGGTEGTSVHGTACAEIIYDIAPNAQFYLTNIDDEIDFANAVDWLIEQDVDIISCSLAYPLWGPGDGTGFICDKVTDAKNAGILWVNAAGNYAMGHWDGDWADTDYDKWLEFIPGLEETNEIAVGEGELIAVYLKWDDPWGYSSNDYDLYLFDTYYNLVAGSESTQNGDDEPVEALAVYAPFAGTYHIAVRRYSASGISSFHLFTYYYTLQIRDVLGSLAVPADSPDAIAVGAVDWYSYGTLEVFSSQGPTDDGRIKPDLVAPDNVSTVSYGPGGFPGGFPGTSAAAPHVAGAAALVKDAHPSYTPAQIHTFLESRATDLDVPGKDNGYGSGRLDLRPPTEQWVVRYNGPENNNDMAQAIAVGEDGNIYVTGWSYGIDTHFDYATVKYTSAGNQLWVARYSSPGNNVDMARAIALDSTGNVYVTGVSWGNSTNNDYTTIKYNSDGEQLWVARYNGPANSGDGAYAIAVDERGYVYVTGSSVVDISRQDDYATVKYDSEGNQLWVASYNGPANIYDIASAIAVDGLGNVYVTGGSMSEAANDYATVKYDSEGNQLWVARYNGPGNHEDIPQEIVLDESGNVYITGYSVGINTYEDYATVKYSDAGEQLWVKRYDGPGSGVDKANDIAVDSSGNVYITGLSFRSGTYEDYATIKYDSAGNSLWVVRYDGPGSYRDFAYALNLDDSGNLYVTGESYNTQTFAFDYATVKYNSQGNPLWVARYDGPGSNSDTAQAIVEDEAGNVYITGYSVGRSGSDLDYTTIKYVEIYKPIVITNSATNVLANSATIQGTLDDLGTAQSVQASFEWGETTAYGNELLAQSLTAPGAFSANLTDLEPNTTYYFRAKGTGDGTAYGYQRSFKTSPVLEIPLKAGWNMVSVPIIPSDNSVDAVFPDVAAVYTWDAVNKHYVVPAIIEPDRGYLVAVTEDTTINVTGTPVTTWTVDIKAGWNMIGSVFNNASIADPEDNPDGSVQSLACWWDPAGKNYIFTTDIEPGKAYLVAATQDCTLTLSSP